MLKVHGCKNMAIKQGHGWKDKLEQGFHKCLDKKRWGCLFERKQWSHLQRRGQDEWQ